MFWTARVHGQWLTQSFELKDGWNAIYLGNGLYWHVGGRVFTREEMERSGAMLTTQRGRPDGERLVNGPPGGAR